MFLVTILLALRSPAAAAGAVGPLRVPNAGVADSLRAAYA
jgi:predicted small lipoprotein YifL